MTVAAHATVDAERGQVVAVVLLFWIRHGEEGGASPVSGRLPAADWPVRMAIFAWFGARVFFYHTRFSPTAGVPQEPHALPCRSAPC